MGQVQVDLGAGPNTPTGDTAEEAFIKVNLNATDAETRLTALESPPIVQVNVKADFPAPAAGIITLANNTSYRINADIDLGSDVIVLGVESVIAGISVDSSRLTSTGTPLIDSNGNATRISRIELDSPGTGILHTVGPINLLFVRLINQTLGLKAASFINMIITLSSFEDNTNCISTTATTSNAVIITDTQFLSYSGNAFDVTGALIEKYSITGSIFTGDGGSFAIVGDAASANVTGSASVAACIFNGAGASTFGIVSRSDIRWFFDASNIGVTQSSRIADLRLTSNATVTALTEDTPVALAGTWSEIDVSQFTTNAAGVITYIGVIDIVASVKVALFGDIATGNNQRCHGYIAKNGTEITDTLSTHDFDAADPDSFDIFAEVPLSTNDTMQTFFENTSSDNDFTGIDVHVVVTS